MSKGCGKQYFGKYRGKVESNIDPLMLGRVQVSVPSILGDGTFSWAMPCVPYAGDGVGFFAIPPRGANIWVEFEGGDPDYPIWAGCFWGVGEVPATPALAEIKMLKTENITLTMSDLPGAGGVTLEVNSPAVAMPLKMDFSSSGIEILNDPVSIKLTPTDVEIETPTAKAIFSPDGIKLDNAPSTIKLSAQGIEMEIAPASIKLSSEGIDIENTPASAKFSSDGIELKNAAASGKFSSDGIEFKNGAASVKLSPASVSINEGALEII